VLILRVQPLSLHARALSPVISSAQMGLFG
jgi:hypothetical protein